VKDIAFREKELATFAAAFPEARVVRMPGVGHNPAEERGEELARAMEPLLTAR
jgi:pimeloyl-ACP methyl ester carboxylesterase